MKILRLKYADFVVSLLSVKERKGVMCLAFDHLKSSRLVWCEIEVPQFCKTNIMVTIILVLEEGTTYIIVFL